ncbi:hypothetical protein KM043_000677 [Ampulex compressa]|nr:hypothetical protein KM043_000677 [Ampulex compressa]
MGVKNFLMKRIPFCKMKVKRKYNGANATVPIQSNAQTEQPADFDNASVGSGNSNLSTGALQNIREQMAASLERMKELEEQVKAIPMLQVQVSVLKEEKRSLLRQVDELSKRNSCNGALQRHRSRSFSEEGTCPRNRKSTPTRDTGTMCGVMTRDVGVSHQQVRTRDVGMITSTPIKHPLQRSQLRIEEILPEDQSGRLQDHSPSISLENLYSNDTWRRSSSTLGEMTGERLTPEMKIKRRLRRSPLQIESISPTYRLADLGEPKKKFRDIGINTRDRLRNLRCSRFIVEDIAPEAKGEEIEKRSCGTGTSVRMKDVLTKEDVAVIVDDAVRIYKSTLVKDTVSRACQHSPEALKAVEKRDRFVQVTEQFKMRSNVGVTAKPRTSEVGIEAKTGTWSRSVAVGPDPVSTQPLSLHSLNSRSHSFNYGDTKAQRTATKAVGVLANDLIRTTARSTDTSGLAPKRREFGTSPIKKKFTDVSVGDSVRPHISISCTASYCDNCKETIKNLAKQIANNAENNMNHQNANLVSRIPRPSHIALNATEHRRQFKRQDTYTKIPAAGVIRYDSDNKEQYDSSNRIQQLQEEKSKNEKDLSNEIYTAEKQTENEEKHGLPESALFQPIQENSRKKAEPSKEMQAAMKEWFKISSTVGAIPLEVEDYLDRFEECSGALLEHVVNMTDSSGNTAMHYAVSHGNFDVVSILLDSKVCDINKANVAGYTAVMLAALAEVRNSTHASVANRLFQLADVNIRAKLHGQTALMLAVSHGRKDMTQLLLDAGAAVNIQDEDGSTALMCAAEHGHTDIVRLLLAHPDCDPSIVDIDGSSALKIALEAGNRDIGVLLYAHEHVNRGTSPHSSMRRSRRGSKPTTPTGPSPSAPVEGYYRYLDRNKFNKLVLLHSTSPKDTYSVLIIQSCERILYTRDGNI